ncbi:hypothetical protein BEL04_23430 [Mucilaginibacter sp. PPCGB 2223]|uniref:hypothetical protein n=1 Tax=Mucilaginibacter sp. PPCGB 2223 TaxID=1886027 RepID=UPI0008260E6B|nr:hypothetical protein [Mucilaginibacter sp. PPCGB 2223]OCX50265.1 hypothetical protein BEL04_23430 [Mucilaginibacter sp. PPCGB 2223]
MKRLFFILFSLVAVSAFAQQKPERPLVQFSGVVLNSDSTSIIPYTSVTNISNPKQSNLANYKGYFSFVVHENDTLQFTSIGYASAIVVIPSHLKEKSYTVEVRLRSQSVHLPVVHIFPWATTDEFHKDFLAMKIADDDLEIARKNLSGKSIAALERSLPLNAQDHQTLNFQDMHNNMVNQHSLMPNPLLNPFAWGALIKEIAAGNKSRGIDDN